MLGTLRPGSRHEGAGLHPAVERGGAGVDDALHREGGRRDDPCCRGDEGGGRREVALGHCARALPNGPDRAGRKPRTCDGDDLPVGEAG